MTGAEARAILKAAGFTIGPEPHGGLVSVSRGAAKIWLDTGDTIGRLGNKSDVDSELYLDVIGLLDGAEAGERIKLAMMEGRP